MKYRALVNFYTGEKRKVVSKGDIIEIEGILAGYYILLSGSKDDKNIDYIEDVINYDKTILDKYFEFIKE